MRSREGLGDGNVSHDLMSLYDFSNESFNLNENNSSFPNYNNSTETVQFSLAFQIIIYVIYNTVFVAALLGNILVCYVVFSSPRMRTVTNYLIANLAVGDLLMALLCVPFSYISVLLQYWPFGEVLCHLVAPAQAVCVFVSAYTLVALAGDRYVAILYPLKPRLRRSQALIVIFFVWIIAFLTAIPIAIYTDMVTDNGNPECTEVWPDENYKLIYSLTLMILQYFFPLAVLVFTYTRIALAVWGKKAPGEAEDGRDQRLAKAKRKTVVMTLAVVAGYTICWLPMNTMNLVLGIYPPAIENPPDYFIYLYFSSHWLAMAHTTYNPLIYAWINARFRSAFKQVFTKVDCCPLSSHGGSGGSICLRSKKQRLRGGSNTFSTATCSTLRTHNTRLTTTSNRFGSRTTPPPPPPPNDLYNNLHSHRQPMILPNGSPVWT